MRKSFILISCVLLLSGCGGAVGREGKLEEDKKLQEELSKISVPTVDKSIYSSALAAMENGEYVKAQQFLKQLIGNDNKNDLYKEKYAEVLRYLGACKSAMPVYDHLLSKKPDDIGYKEGKGLCLLSEGDFQEAGEIFTEIINSDSSRWKSINGAGLIFASKKKFTEANQYFDLAAEVSNDNATVLNNQGLAKGLMGNYTDAIEILQKAAIRADNVSQKTPYRAESGNGLWHIGQSGCG